MSTLHGPDLRRRITQLMLLRLVALTVVLGATVGLHYASPDQLTKPNATWLFALVAANYALTLGYALVLPRIKNVLRFADAQITLDLGFTTALIHLTGGAQSGFGFFFPLSIIAAASLRYRRGAISVAVASILLFAGVSLLGWLHWLPIPDGQQLLPWELKPFALVREIVVNAGAFGTVAVLAAHLGEQLRLSGVRLESQRIRTADLAALNEDIIRSLLSGLITIDAEGTVLTFNRTASELLGLQRTEARGRPLSEVFPELATLISGLDLPDAIRRAEIEAARPGHAAGPAVLGISVSPITDHQGIAVGRIANIHDLSELRKMELQVRRAEHLATVGEMAAALAHEVRNPLASISGAVELLRSNVRGDDDSDALTAIVLREVGRLDGLVTDLLEYSRPRERIFAPIDLAPLLTETVRVFAQDATTPKVQVSYSRVTSDPGTSASMEPSLVIQGDVSQLRQVLWNLMRNAVEATPSYGHVVVRLAQAARADGVSVARISVTDEGGGILVEDLERIFQPFFTTKPGGTGLGLPLVQRIVTEHGGTISVETTPGFGTEFQLLFPLAESPGDHSL
ncbi:MAG: PAS domain S-box protein [Myxococcales bacterium]|nr:PAS domain S-box protein [Myxococcales bacterium]